MLGKNVSNESIAEDRENAVTYYQFIRRCLLLDAAGTTALRENVSGVLMGAKKKEGEGNAKGEGADAGK